MKFITIFLLTMSFTLKAQAPAFMHLLNKGKLEIRPSRCEEEDDAVKKQCVKELCADAKTSFPMLIEDSDLANYVKEHEGDIKPELKSKIRRHLEKSLKQLIASIEKLQGLTADEIVTQIDTTAKQNFASQKIMQDCTPSFDASLPVEERFTLQCPDEVKDSPLLAEISANYLAEKKSDLGAALVEGLYTLEEVRALVPGRLAVLKARFDELKADPQEDMKKMLDFMGANWDKFEKLDYAGQMHFLKGLSKIPEASEVGNYCKSKECVTYFDDYVKTDKFKTDLKDLHDKITDPQFLETNWQLLQVQEILNANGPDENDIKTIEEKKQQTVAKLMAYQKKLMSEHSFDKYQSELKDVVVSYDDESFKTRETGSTDDVEFEYPISIPIALLPSGEEGIGSFLDVTLDSPVALISDYYTDPMYNEFEDENYDKTQIRLSIFSYKDSSFGMQILAHELGHHFSHLHTRGELSTKTSATVTKSKNCIKSRYAGYEKVNGKGAGELYLEEEFADEFGFTINDANTPALFCPLLTSKDPQLSLEIMKSQDSHQTDLWRSLNHLKSSGKKFPESCQKLLDQEAPNYVYKKCL